MQLEAFLKQAKYFSLGHLPTEGFHPETRELSDWIHTDLSRAIQTVQQIDLDSVQIVKQALPLIESLSKDIHETLERGSRVFLSGCGATGRLALTLESLWRSVYQGKTYVNSVQGLMAGGDFALVKSVENFEDYPEYGARHLESLGFKEGDLLIAITEGGETPYVIGTVHHALKASSRKPWFVYCNPKDLLCKTVERSREVIENPRVKSLCLPVGQMALSGSTRLQAATAQMMAVGIALLKDFSLPDFFMQEFAKVDLANFLAPVIAWETRAYQEGGAVLYQTTTYPIAVLTDTTERSPTFSLTPFEKTAEESHEYSLCYLSIPDAKNALQSWQRILNRDPIGLDWPDLQNRLNLDSILEFDFGETAIGAREKKLAPKIQHSLHLNTHEREHTLEFKSETFDQNITTLLLSNPLAEQIFVKLILNTLSLMVMGNMNRFEGNVMTWVRPSNGKLIDRTLRYLKFLIMKRGLQKVDDHKLLEMIFETRKSLHSDEAVILSILKKL